VTALSGGNQQKVVIGKTLLTRPKVLLLDEPSRGIDIGAKAEVFRTMRKLADDGLAVLFSTSDLMEVRAVADRILVMSNGKLTGNFTRQEATEEALVAASTRNLRGGGGMSGAETMTAKSKPGMQRISLLVLLLNMRTFIALIVVFAYFGATAPNFLTLSTQIIVAKHVAINAFLAIGMTFVILTGGIDLSVGSIVGVAGIVAGGLINYGLPIAFLGITIYPNVVEVILITLLIGMAIGAFNGVLVTSLNVAPFIATLGTLYIARGVALLISNGQTFPNLVGEADLENTGFPFLGSGTILGLPVSIVGMILLALIMIYVTKRTPFGRQVYAVGGNERASELSGIRVNRIKLSVYVISGFCAALAGLVVASELVAAHPASGESFELNAIAAAVLGGTSLAGGRGSIGGTVIGAFVIGVLSDGLVMLGVSSFWQMVIKGLVIVAAVVLDQLQRKLQRRMALQAQMD